MKHFNALKTFRQIVKNLLNRENKANQHRKINSKHHFNQGNRAKAFAGGMGLITATEIVKERIDENIIKEYGVDVLDSAEHYYIARLSEVKGSINHTMLVDKKNGIIQPIYRKPTSKPIA